MCTAITYKTKDFYFGRTLDYDFSYNEKIVITPRNYILKFRHAGVLKRHYAMIGVAHIEDNTPLYYDAANEKGLAMAGLNFVGNACYKDINPCKNNIANFEFIQWILSQCASVYEAKKLIEKTYIVKTKFSEALPISKLHWMIADYSGAIVVESTKNGINVYDNPTGVLTNNPTFPEQIMQLNNYMNLSPREPKNNFSKDLSLHPYSRGMGAIGLPGDLSSQSRFVRAAFVRMNSISGNTEKESVNQFFHILSSVEQPRGCCILPDGKCEITIYTSCCNASRGIYYYTTYNNHQITAIDMHFENLDSTNLICYTPIEEEQIKLQNFRS